MPIEAELKARVREVTPVRTALAGRVEVQLATYHDTYFDRRRDAFMTSGQELRLRTIRSPENARHVLTYKAPAVDRASASKPEYETDVADRDATESILRGLGFEVAISFTKQCENYPITHSGYDILATLVTVPELDGTFIEVETLISSAAELHPALDAVHAVLADLGVSTDDLTTEPYTDAVAKVMTAAPQSAPEVC